MVPVELRVSNFLSYGEDEQILDFSRFHVACLSGKNGQGKSALLDAITWVLWGEARKSSGGHKPDEELLRIGARRMRVELVFEAEDARYRTIRAYTRSASGKTSKTELELQLIEEETGEGRPLTRASIRETQDQLNEVLGLDYQTFINSAFLLQGRSDEFTKKKPGERKQILGRILNLEKYDRLAVMARDRQKNLSDEIDLRDREIERLTAALESESEWKTLFSETTVSLKELEKQLQDLRSEESKLTERMAALDALSREATLHREVLNRLIDQKKSVEDEQQILQSRIVGARELIEKKDRIEKDFQRYEALLKERDELDGRRDLYRGIERQMEQKKTELQQLRFEQEQKKHQLEVDLRAGREALADVMESLKGKAEVEMQLSSARDAFERVRRMRSSTEERNRLLEKKREVEQKIAKERDSLFGRLNALEAQAMSRKKSRGNLDELVRQRSRLEQEVEKQRELALRKEEVKKQGQELSEAIRHIEGEVRARREELEKVQAQYHHLESTTASTCPTCGSELTDAHRTELMDRLRAEKEAIETRLNRFAQETKSKETERQSLREEYADVQAREKSLGEPAQKLAQIQEKISMAESEIKSLELQEEEIRQLRAQLEEKRYAMTEQQSSAEMQRRLEELVIDDGALRNDEYEAAQVQRFEERLRSIKMAESRQEKLQTQIAAQDRQLTEMRRQIESGDQASTLQEAIQALHEKMAAVGFDAERLEIVRREYRELADAPIRMKDLVNARQNLSEWEERQKQLQDRLREIEQEEMAIREKVDALAAQLDERDSLQQNLSDVLLRREETEQGVRTLQLQHGELTARLDQAAKDRAALRKARELQKVSRHDYGLYGKLRRAFGRNGIPSLIIEQTLPEIEERTNDLLQRLADGKMNVRLETLRDKKTGGTRETLEIIITDEQGAPRPYETFSGGEAFRVNFALRIALSQILAARSGVKIRTLGIDEGFGTQDEQGIQNMVDAIQVIQDDFAKIIVITHLDRLKEAFPVRIEVEKDPVMGSRFMMIEG